MSSFCIPHTRNPTRNPLHRTPDASLNPRDPSGFMVNMGACMSTNGEETEMKKRSQKIDKDLEEDSKRLRRECKILLLGMSLQCGGR